MAGCAIGTSSGCCLGSTRLKPRKGCFAFIYVVRAFVVFPATCVFSFVHVLFIYSGVEVCSFIRFIMLNSGVLYIPLLYNVLSLMFFLMYPWVL